MTACAKLTQLFRRSINNFPARRYIHAMTDRNRERFTLLGLIAIATAVFFTGINWGLPSRAADKFLFGNAPVWTGEQILKLAGDLTYDEARGADVAMHRIDRSH